MKRYLKILLLMTMVSLLAVTLALSRQLDWIDSGQTSEHHVEEINIDPTTVQIIINAVQKKALPAEELIALTDSLNRVDKYGKYRNPFIIPSVSATSTAIEPTSTIAQPKRTAANRPKVEIEGIVWDSIEPYAIINGEVYKIGDPFENYIVHSILDTMVVFANSKDVFTSSLSWD